jgi:hypothetical protein
MMLASLLLRYDIKTKDGVRPVNTKLQAITLPDMKAEILFRRRRI